MIKIKIPSVESFERLKTTMISRMSNKILKVIIISLGFKSILFPEYFAAYLVLQNNSPLLEAELELWRTTQSSIQEQLWVNGRDGNNLVLPQGCTATFVPESLMQAYALKSTYDKIRTDAPFTGTSVDSWPILFEEFAENAQTSFSKGYENLLEIFPPRDFEPGTPQGLDPAVRELIEKNKRTLIEDAEEECRQRLTGVEEECRNLSLADPSTHCCAEVEAKCREYVALFHEEQRKSLEQEEIQKFYLDFNFGESMNRFNKARLKKQFDLENKFFEQYKAHIITSNWEGILNEVYPELSSANKTSHFINLAYKGIKYKDYFLPNFNRDRENLKKSILFENACEKENLVALLRGTNGTRYFENFLGNGSARPRGLALASVSFGRGYYSGVLRDLNASVCEHAICGDAKNEARYLVGLKMRRVVSADLMVIPPITWFRNLGLKGELWHPRTTVAIDLPFNNRDTAVSIDGVAHGGLIDKLGVFVKVKDSREHQDKIFELFKRVTLL